MKKIYFSISLFFAASSLNAQQTIGFESFTLSPESSNNGATITGGFTENGVNFSNTYNPAGYMQNGFAITNSTNTTTAGYTNQYSSIVGKGANNSINYGVCNSIGSISFGGQGVDLDSFKITNTTYAALSMKDGDSFAKKFGSLNNAAGTPDGTNGADYFRVWIIANAENGTKIDSTVFYLADFRFADNSKDYIVNTWKKVDLSMIQKTVYSLSFRIESSDVGTYGMNTPGFFAIDDFSFNKNAAVTVTSTDADRTICAGDKITFTAKPILGGVTPIYQWKVGGTNVGTDSTQYTTTSLTDGQSVVCEMTSNLPGVSGSPVTSTASVITVNPIPATPIVTVSTTGGTTVLTSTESNGNRWYSANLLINSTGSQTFTPSFNGDFYAVVQLNGCSSLASNVTGVTVLPNYNKETIGFESFILSPETFNNGATALGGFNEGGVRFSNTYNPAYGGYMQNGFAITNSTNTTTAGYTNQYSSIVGKGANNSTNYGIVNSKGTISFNGLGVDVDSLKITNTTYAALSMKDGDSFAKKFGSLNNAGGTPDGTNGADYFRVWIVANAENGTKIDSTVFYLADFRATDNTQDYIVNTWKNIDLTFITQPISSLNFRIESSDVGTYGMNTPGFFAIDNVSVSKGASLSENTLSTVSVYPNPIQNELVISGENGLIELMDVTGKIIISTTHSQYSVLDGSNLNSGSYILKLTNESGALIQKLVK